MTRPHKFIRVKRRPDGSFERLLKDGKNGVEIHGLSYNESNGEYYSIPKAGQYRYWSRDLRAAIAEYRASLMPDMSDWWVALNADLDASPNGFVNDCKNIHNPNTHVGRLAENARCVS